MTPLVRRTMKVPLDESSLVSIPPGVEIGYEARHVDRAFQSRRSSQWAIPVSIVLTYPRVLLKTILLSLCILLSTSASPLILREIISGLEGRVGHLGSVLSFMPDLGIADPHRRYALICSALLCCSSAVSILSLHHIFLVQPMLGARVRAVLNFLIYNKALAQSRGSASDLSSGFIVNLVGTDTMKIYNFLGFMHSAWIHPLQLCIAAALLYMVIGVPALIGCSSLVILLLTSVAISRNQTIIRRDLSKTADKRVSLTHEALVHIKAAKFQGWEENIATKIDTIREHEVRLARSLAKLSGVSSFTAGSAPAIAMAITCLTALSQGKNLPSSVVFPMLALFMMLRHALNNLPNTLFNFLEAWVSLRRIHSFLTTPDYQARTITPSSPYAIELRDVAFEWADHTRAVLVGDLTIERGELVVIIGSVGSGKTAFLLGLLGELTAQRGAVSLGGEFRYVAQSPWIVSDSIRANIICDAPFDQVLYQRVIEATALTRDLESFPHGDHTMIGERGVNLSGGQRQRVALARALYSGPDIYLLDDPLSALDPHVAGQVYSNLIHGELKTSTRVLVSHRVEFARSADRVLVIENGAVVESGSPVSLSKPGTRFFELLEYHARMTPESEPLPEAKAVEGSSIAELDNQTETTNQIVSLEERSTGVVDRRVVGRYLARLAPGVTVIVLLALFIGRQGAAVAADLWLSRSSLVSPDGITNFMLGYLVCILGLCASAYFRSMYLLTRGLIAGVECHSELLRGVLRAPLKFFEANPVGRILNRFSRDLEAIELALPASLLDAGHCVFEALAICLVVAAVAPITLVILAPVTLSYLLLQRMFRPISRDTQRLNSLSLSPIFALLSESLTGVETIRSARLSGTLQKRFLSLLVTNARVLYTQTSANRWVGIRLELLGTAVIASVGCAASLQLGESAGIGLSALILSYASNMTGSMNWAIRSISLVESNLTSFERIESYTTLSSEKLAGQIPATSWPEHGRIQIRDLTVTYRENLPPTLRNISCDITAGTRVGIVGRTGSGKSTLILAIMRLLEPCSGYVEVDGLRLCDLNLDSLRRSIAVVPQDPVLFSGILRESLDPFNQHSDQEIVSALAKAQLTPFFDSLSLGLNTRVREGGANFSCGQRQLICLARALLRQSKVLILDEATASIDVETDFAIQKTIREHFRDSTVLVIAHRLGTIIDSDLIIVLDSGKITEFGPPRSLLASRASSLSRLVHELRDQSTIST